MAEIINNSTNPDAYRGKSILDLPYRFRLSPPVDNFCGRDADLENIKKCLENSTTTISQKTVFGVGGVGKTELVKAFAMKYQDVYPIIIYIIGDNTQKLYDNFVDIANEFKIPIENKGIMDELTPRSVKDIVDDVYIFLQSSGDTLVILDTVDELKRIKEYLPRQTSVVNESKLHVLITCRDRNWDSEILESIEGIEITKLTNEDAFNFIVKTLEISVENDTDKQIVELCNLLDHLPFTLNIAVTYIKNENIDLGSCKTKYKIRDYINEYKIHKSKLLERKDGCTAYNSVQISLNMIIEKIKENEIKAEKAFVIIHQMSYFPPSYIPVDIFNVDTNTEAAKTVAILERHCLINRHENHFKMHPLIREFVKIKIDEINGRQKVILDSLVNVLNTKSESFSLPTIIYVCLQGMIEVVKHIIESDYDVKETVNINSNALFHAQNLDVLKFLIESKKFDINYENKSGCSIWIAAFARINLFWKLDLETVKGLNELDLFQINEKGSKVLAYVSLLGNIDTLKYLIEELGLNLNKRDLKGRTMLMCGSMGKSVEIIEYILQHSDNRINDRDVYGITLLMWACSHGTVEIIKYLLDTYSNDLDLNDKDKEGRTVLTHASLSGNIDTLRYLVEELGLNLNERHSNGMTTLMCGCTSDNVEIVEYILQHSDNKINDKNVFGTTALMLSCRHSSVDVIKYLIENYNDQINLNDKDKEGSTILVYACQSDNIDTLRYLIEELGLNLNERDSNERTTLMFSCIGNSIEIIEYVLNHSDNKINDKDKNRTTSLMLACRYSSVDVIRYLIETYNDQIDLNDKDKTGDTVLTYASKSGNIDSVKYLVNELGFNLNERNFIGETMLMQACVKGSIEFFEYVLKNSNNRINDRDIFGYTPLMHAYESGNLTIIKHISETYSDQIRNEPAGHRKMDDHDQKSNKRTTRRRHKKK